MIERRLSHGVDSDDKTYEDPSTGVVLAQVRTTGAGGITAVDGEVTGPQSLLPDPYESKTASLRRPSPRIGALVA